MKSISEASCYAYGRRLPIDFFLRGLRKMPIDCLPQVVQGAGSRGGRIGMASFERSLLCCHDIC